MTDELLRRNLQAIDAPMRPNPVFVDELHARLSGELGFAAATTVAVRPQPTPRLRARQRGPVGWLAVAALLVLALLALLLGQQGRTPEESRAPASPVSPSPASVVPATPSPALAAIPSPAPSLDHLRGDGMVLFELGDVTETPRLRVLQPDLSSTELLPAVPGVQARAAWHPEGRRLAFTTYDAADLEARPLIWETDSEGTEPTLLSEECDAPTCLAEYEPWYSPDGARLAFVRTRSTDAGDRESVVAIRDLATGDVTELESTSRPRAEEENLHPRWSPDGLTIAYGVADYDLEGFIEGSSIHLVGADGTNDRAITAPEVEAGDPEWSADGRTILFASQPIRAYILTGARDVDRMKLFLMSADGSNIRGFELVGAVGAASWTAEGQILFSFLEGAGDFSPGHPRLYVMDPDGANVLPITSSLGTSAWYAIQQPLP